MEIIPENSMLLGIEVKCPACNKKNTTYACTRCSCDLEPLFSIIKISDNKINLGKKFLTTKDGEKANEYALQAWKLKKTKEAALLGFCACCLNKDYPMANIWLKAAKLYD